MEPGFRHAFSAAWQAYCDGNIPIGAAILNEDGAVVAVGRNSVYGKRPVGTVSNHPLAHAELNAILQVNGLTDEQVGRYTLYTTMEPCPLCFGATVMGRIRRLRFAARDEYAGAAGLNGATEFLRRERLDITGPDPLLEGLQIALIVARRLHLALAGSEEFLTMYRRDCPLGVAVGERLAQSGWLEEKAAASASADVVCDHVLLRLMEGSASAI